MRWTHFHRVWHEGGMKLYFSPLACSMATRIALYEAGAPASFVEVDGKTKQTEDGRDFRTIHPLGLVPVLERDDGQLLTENAAILQHVAEAFPAAAIGARDAGERARLQQWLSFIGTELHKAVYVPLLDRQAPEAVKAYSLAKAPPRLAWVSEQLGDRAFALDHFSIVDAYLFTVLNWSQVTPIRLADWPALAAYMARLRDRPAIARAFGEEAALYAREVKRHAP